MIAILVFFIGLIQNSPGWKYADPSVLCSLDSVCASAEGTDGNPSTPLVIGNIDFDIFPCELSRVTVSVECAVSESVVLFIDLHNEQGGLLQSAVGYATPINGSVTVEYTDPVFSAKLLRDDFTVHITAVPIGDYSFGIGIDYFGISAVPF